MRFADRGFSLIEMLVALAVFALAVLALLHLSGQNARSALGVEEQLFAGIVADTQAAEALLLPPAALAREATGTERAGGRDWRWTRRASPAPGGALLRVDIEVRAAGEARLVRDLQLFVPAP